MLFTDQSIPFVIAALSFVVIGLLSIGIFIHLEGLRYRRKMLKKIQQNERDWSGVNPDVPSLESANKSANPLVNLLSFIGMRTASKKSGDDIGNRLKFLRAGIRSKNAATVFLGTKFLLMVAFPAIFLFVVIFVVKEMQSNHVLLGSVFLALMGITLPDAWLKRKTRRRTAELVKAFPDALDMLVVCVEAGMGLDSSIRRVGDEIKLSHPALSQELDLLNLELRAGKTRKTALLNLAKRTDIDDVNNLVTLLIQTDRFGTSVTKTLRVFADSFRSARFQRAEEAAAKISTKLIFPLAFFIFPSLFLVMIGPGAIQFYRMFYQG